MGEGVKSPYAQTYYVSALARKGNNFVGQTSVSALFVLASSLRVLWLSGIIKWLLNISKTNSQVEILNQEIQELINSLAEAEQNEDWDTAIRLGEKILELDNNQEQTRKNLCYAYYRHGRDHYY